MEGYGRWITLAIIMAVFLWLLYNNWKEDKEETRLMLLYLAICIAGIGLISFISQIW